MGHLLGFGIIIGTSIWMAIDASRLHYDKRDIKRVTAMGPVEWLISGLLLWIIVFPMYVSRRPMLREAGRRRQAAVQDSAGQHAVAQAVPAEPLPGPSIPLFLVTFAASTLALGAVAVGPAVLDSVAPSLPACSSPDVTRLAERVLSSNPAVKAANLSADWGTTGEVRTRRDPPRRICRTTVTSVAGTEALYFAVEWHQKEKRIIYVQVLGDRDDGQ